MKVKDFVLNKNELKLLNNCILTIEEVYFSVRTTNLLKGANIKTIKCLSKIADYDLLKLRGMGKKSYLEIKCKLHEILQGNLNLDICNLNEQIRSLERHVDDLRDELEVAKEEWKMYMPPLKAAQDFINAIADYRERIQGEQ